MRRRPHFQYYKLSESLLNVRNVCDSRQRAICGMAPVIHYWRSNARRDQAIKAGHDRQ
jgi:hypothetical protein